MKKQNRGDLIVAPLPSGYYRISGRGPCNWTQPPTWPCDEQTIRRCAFPEASEEFLAAVVSAARELEKVT